MSEEAKIPKYIFIVPYRNRAQHKFFFCKYMSFILEDKNDYEILFIHQCDARTFNRGAVKNIGFIAARNKYPEHYKDINFIFNDVDTIPFNKIFDYETTTGVVKHYYGFKYALGGIVVMKGSDFERTNGFPCFWGWGMEDNVLQKRCEHLGIKIDRSVFYNIGSPEILQLFDGISRIISKKDPWRGQHDNGIDGLKTITQLKYTIDDKSDNPNDNIFVVHNEHIKTVNIQTFLTYIPFGAEEYYNYDLREPKRKIIHPDKISETKKSVVTTTDWTNIPYYPTSREKRENVATYLTKMGRQIPPELLKQIQEDKIKEIEEDAFNTFSKSNNSEGQVESDDLPSENLFGYYKYHQPQQNSRPLMYQNYIHNLPIIPIHNQMSQPPNKFSPQYASYIGAKPRAQASTRVRLGGVF
jgi:Txe/YoeB family toxin of Txe-Axe toxin-antitoxin module